MKRKKVKHKIYLFFIILSITILSASATFVAIIHSNYGQQKIKSLATYFAQKNNIHLKIGSIKGTLPLQITLVDSEITLPSNQNLKVDTLSFHLSFFSLFRNELRFQDLEATGIYISSLPKNTPLKEKINFEIAEFSLPFALSFESLNLKNIHFNGLVFNTSGNLFLKKRLNRFSSHLTFNQENEPDFFFKLFVHGNKKTNLIKIKTEVSSTTKDLLTSWLTNEKATIYFEINSRGSWNNFEELLFRNKKNKNHLISGTCNGFINSDKFTKLNLNRLNLEFSFGLKTDLSGTIDNMTLENNFLKAFGKCILEENLSLAKVDFAFDTTSLSLFDPIVKIPLKGTIDGLITGSTRGISISFKGNNLQLSKYPISSLDGHIYTKKEDKDISGQISSNITVLGESVSLFCNYLYNLNGTINLKQISLTAPSFDLASNLQITKDNLLLGFTQVNFNNLNVFKEFFPNLDFNSNIGASLHLFAEDGKQTLKANMMVYDYHMNDLIGEKADFDILAKDIFNTPKISLEINSSNLRFYQIKIESLNFKTLDIKGENHYELLALGKWRSPLEIRSQGSWKSEGKEISLTVESLQGVFINQNYHLQSPVTAAFGKDHFHLKNFEIKMSSGSLIANILLSKELSDLKIVTDHFPIDFLSFNPPEVSVFGFASTEIYIKQKGKEIEGNFNISLDGLHIAAIADAQPLSARGFFAGSIENSLIKGKGKIESLEKNSFLEFNGELPTEIVLMPPSLKILPDNKLNAEMSILGKIEDLLDFVNIGNQRIEGEIDCFLSLSNTFSNPQLSGSCSVKKGFYENYVTGTYFQDIDLNFTTKNHDLEIESFSARGLKKGNIAATGHIDLRRNENYRFDIDIKLDDINIFQTGLVTAAMKGDLKVTGDKKEAFAKGRVEITHAKLTIPDKIPVSMPEMDVTFINKELSQAKNIPKKAPYPINLDIVLFSSENIFIKGKGVDARLKGKVELKGTNTNMIPKGNLVLVKGNYLFAGKYFDLSESTIFFSGEKNALPKISIGAKTMVQGILIVASLQGPLNAPALSFSSSPSLSTSSILSLLIFGRDLSGISALQALQVATMVAALSEGGGILETTKRNLGIDRLAVVSKSGETAEDPDQIAIEVGKYITRGLLVSYKQGVDSGMSNASAEIDIGWGFIFQIETIREEEQTRATLKWSKNF